MKLPKPKIAATLLLFLLLSAIVPYGAAIVSAGSSDSTLPSWEIRFGSTEAETVEEAVAASEDEWIRVTPHDNKSETPRGTSSAWLRISLPQISDKSALFIDKVYGNNVKAYLNNALVYESENKYNFHLCEAGFNGSHHRDDTYFYSHCAVDLFVILKKRIFYGRFFTCADYFIPWSRSGYVFFFSALHPR